MRKLAIFMAVCALVGFPSALALWKGFWFSAGVTFATVAGLAILVAVMALTPIDLRIACSAGNNRELIARGDAAWMLGLVKLAFCLDGEAWSVAVRGFFLTFTRAGGPDTIEGTRAMVSAIEKRPAHSESGSPASAGSTSGCGTKAEAGTEEEAEDKAKAGAEDKAEVGDGDDTGAKAEEGSKAEELVETETEVEQAPEVTIATDAVTETVTEPVVAPEMDVVEESETVPEMDVTAEAAVSEMDAVAEAEAAGPETEIGVDTDSLTGAEMRTGTGDRLPADGPGDGPGDGDESGPSEPLERGGGSGRRLMSLVDRVRRVIEDTENRRAELKSRYDRIRADYGPAGALALRKVSRFALRLFRSIRPRRIVLEGRGGIGSDPCLTGEISAVIFLLAGLAPQWLEIRFCPNFEDPGRDGGAEIDIRLSLARVAAAAALLLGDPRLYYQAFRTYRRVRRKSS